MDKDELRAFMGRFMQMTTGAAVLGIVAVADRTGLFRGLAGAGPLGIEAIAEKTGLQERYLREALSSLAAAEIVRYDPARQTFELPDEHAACLADESSPYFLAGWSQIVPALYGAIPGVVRAFREGGGVPFTAFGSDMVEGIARSNGPGTRILLTRKWLPAMPDVVARLEAGARVADVGCGGGDAAITMAGAYPKSTVTGFDVDETSLARARAAAEQAGVSNVEFERVSAQEFPAEPGFDFITTFDVIHDLADPRGALEQIRRALRKEGTYLMVEPVAGDTLEENLNPAGAMTYAMSTLHCMTQSLAHGGAGLGAAWGPNAPENLCGEVGFTRFRRLDVDNPFNAFYEVRP
ncbi:MAG: class I SAM-dependent methyltransferase [Proteobacteria bacterium]|nr:class I SAM-dependent methyltransferase [Pseudomonadota bacterium]